MQLHRYLLALPLTFPLALLTACTGGSNGGSDPELEGACVVAATQDRDFDATGQTVLVTFDRAVDPTDAADAANYTLTGLVVTSATVVTPTTVRLVADATVIPGDRTLGVAAGIRDEDGVESSAVTGRAIGSTDSTAPDAASISGLTISGANNDEIAVEFDDDMIDREVETPGFWAVESPLGTPVDLTGSSIAYDEATRTATLTLSNGSDLSVDDDVAAVFINMRDIGGNEVRATSFGSSAVSSVVTGDVEPPALFAAFPGDGANDLRVVFDEEVQYVATGDLVQTSTAVGTRFVLFEATNPGVPVHATASVSSLDELGADVTFPIPPEVGDTISVHGVADLAGNVIEPAIGAAVVARDTGDPELFMGSTTLTAVPGERNDLFSVQFDRPMHPSGLFEDFNYGLLYDFFVDTHGAEPSWNGTDTVTFVLSGDTDHDVQSGDPYILAVASLRSAHGVVIDTVTQESGVVAGGDSTAPSLESARIDPAIPNSLLVVFDEAFDADEVAEEADWTIAGRTTFVVTVLGPRTVRVSFTSTPLVGEMLNVAADALTDLAGVTAVSSASIAVTAADATAPTIVSVTAVANAGEANDVVVVTFDEQIDAADAVDPARFTLTNGASVLDLTDADLRWSSVTAATTITMPAGQDLTTGAAFSVDVAGLRDVSGNAIVAANSMTTVTGDATAPAALSAFVDRRRASDGTVVQVTADEALTNAASLALNWSASGGANVLEVQRVSPVRFRVVLDVALGASDTLTLTGAEDLAGNAAAGALVIDPIE